MEGSDTPEVEQRFWRFEPVIFEQLRPKMTLKRFVCNLNDPNYNHYDNTTLSIDIEDVNDHPFESFEKIPIEDAEMFFLKYRASVPSIEDGKEREEAEKAVEESLMDMKPELLQRRGWCSRRLSIEEDSTEDVAERCSYTMNHCTDYKRWLSADQADFKCKDNTQSECSTAGFCSWDGTECATIQTSKSVDCLKEQENGQWEMVCETTHFDAYTGISIAIGSVLIFLFILVSIILVKFLLLLHSIPPTHTPTQKLKNRFLRFSSQKIGSGLLSL